MRAERKCSNRINDSSFLRSHPCYRDANGSDGLCGICRAAIRRGERARQRNDEVRRANEKARMERFMRQMDDQRVGAWLREHDPDKYAEIMEVSK